MSYFYIRFVSGSPSSPTSTHLADGMSVACSDGRVEVRLPFSSTDSLFYRQRDGAVEISNDIRLLYDPGCPLDPAGLFSLVQYGAVVPPLTIFRPIRAFVPGLRHTLDLSSLKIESVVDTHWSSTLPEDRGYPPDRQISILSEMIDDQLTTLSPTEDPILLFSGGVDSGLLASRIAALGWREAQLVHYCFGRADPETALAKSMAKILGLSCLVVEDGEFNSYEVLDRAADIYPFPFCDRSCLPTFSLARAVVERFDPPRVVIEGVGADGALGWTRKANAYNRLYGLPHFVRAAGGSLYRMLELWKRPSRSERVLKLFRRSSMLPALPNAIAQSPLLHLGFFADSAAVNTANQAFGEWIHAVSPSHSENPIITMPLVDVGVFQVRTVAQKNRATFREASFRLVDPFLSQEYLDLAIQHARFWPGSELPKNTMKLLLVSAGVPRDMVYRRKQGFRSPDREAFADPRFLSHLEAATDRASPLADFFNQRMLTELMGMLRVRRDLPKQTYNYLWAAAFINCWITQLEAKRK